MGELAERLAHLRRLRDEGRLIHDRHRLQQALKRDGTPGPRRAYCFRGRATTVPRVKRERPEPKRPVGRVGPILEVDA